MQLLSITAINNDMLFWEGGMKMAPFPVAVVWGQGGKVPQGAIKFANSWQK